MTGPTGERDAAPGGGGNAGPPGRLISFGGLLADLVVGVDAVPARGEDALARDFSQSVGGGFAVLAAAARLGMPTALAGVLGERTMVTVQGVESRVQGEDFEAVAPAPGDIVYLNGYELLYPHAAGLVNWVRRVRPEHLVFDPGPLVAEIDRDALDAVLAATSWLSLNAAEARSLTGEPDPAAAAQALAPSLLPPDHGVDGPKNSSRAGVFGPSTRGGGADRGGGCVVLADGAELAGGTGPVAVPAFAADPVDTTGAGDTHVGAFVAALARGLDPVEACRLGNAAAAHVIGARGQVSPPRLAELQAILARP